MDLTYYLIKYVSDTGDEQPIGLMANDGLKCHFRCLGVISRHEVDPAPLFQRTGLESDDEWAWREWVDWFFDVAENEGVNPAGFEKVMTRLLLKGTSITVSQPNTVNVSRDLSSFVNQLYETHVAP